MSFQNFRLTTGPSQGPTPSSSAHENVAPGALLHSIPLNVHPSSHHATNAQDCPEPQQQRHVSTPLTTPVKDRNARSAKAPYGSGDADDGYTLVFRNMEVSNPIYFYLRSQTHGTGIREVEGEGGDRKDGRICKGRHPWLKGRAPTVQGPYKARLCSSPTKRQEEVCEEIPRSAAQGAQS